MITSKFFNMGQVVTTRSINDLMAADNGNLLISNGSERRQAVIMEDCA